VDQIGILLQVLRIKAKKEIDSYNFEDFELLGYKPHKKIAMEMAV
jgi:thymidylate synthase